ncbi:cytochrome P450 [Thiorhodococcus mannitoliphagus]|uniref:Cytochrome P450 n=1 Tax=Thiorhodococcus mannitoliphagus TaxID=329406 RepID=A0A6P1E3T3_9GAMM|nr:cytochrome P450 [Thiorhodococcus mannitoliphagus]NEX23172.1 cytochrome P450 [Thiorhodococcus mannitoliphagus]
MNSAFDAIPRYTPPYPERPPRRLPALRALLQFGQDALKPFEVGTFSRPFTRRRILGRELVILNHPEWVREAFVKRHEVLQRKTPQMRQALEPLLGDGLFVSDGPLWKARRALVSPLVSGRHLDRFLPIMLETAREWRALWRQHPADRPIDVLNEMGTLTAEIISRAIFGQRAGREQTDQIVRNFAHYQRQIEQTAVAEMLNLPGWIPRFHGRGIRRPIQRIHAVVDHIIDAQLKPSGQASAAPDGCPVGAMIDQLFTKAEGPDASLDRRAVRNEAIVLFMAGHETTANTLAWAFFLLSQAPWARAALARELERIPPERELAVTDLDALIYTRAVIEETLRLYPPVPILGRTATADTEIGGERIRQGSLVLVVPWLLHRNPELWERPDDFLPERFLPGAERPSKYQYAPFSVGPRVCPGLAFGLNEAVLCLAVLARAFDWELAPGAKVFPSTRLTLRPGDRLPMLLRERANP